MAGLAAIVVAAALLEDDDLLALRLGDDFGRNRHLGGVGDLLALARQQDIAQRYRVAGFARQLLDRDLVSGGNPVLLAASTHYCEHGIVTSINVVVAAQWTGSTSVARHARERPQERRS